LVGINSARPTPPFVAQGTVGDAQIEQIARAARCAAEKGLFVCFMLHHPPLPGQAPERRALTDANKMAKLIAETPVGLVIYGHNHTDVVSRVSNGANDDGTAAICGAASGSAVRRHGGEPLARYYLYIFTRDGQKTSVERVTRGLNETRNDVIDIARMQIHPV